MSKWHEAIGRGQPLRIGHRGAAGLAPMNTLLSFQRAIDLGVDAVELDVRWTADRQLVVIHDDDLAHSTDGVGLVDEQSFADLRGVDAGQGERIPSLDEALELVKGKALVVVDLKLVGYEEQIARSLVAHGMQADALVCSTIRESFDRLRAAAPGVFTAFSYPEDTGGASTKPYLKWIVNLALAYMRVSLPWRIGAMMDAVGADGTMLYHKVVTRSTVEAAHRRGKFIGAWTADEPADIARLRAAGVDSITSNRPDLFLW